MIIVHKNKLLQNIADGLKDLNVNVQNVKITFKGETGSYDFSLPAALDALVNHLYFDERGDWSMATEAEVSVI